MRFFLLVPLLFLCTSFYEEEEEVNLDGTYEVYFRGELLYFQGGSAYPTYYIPKPDSGDSLVIKFYADVPCDDCNVKMRLAECGVEEVAIDEQSGLWKENEFTLYINKLPYYKLEYGRCFASVDILADRGTSATWNMRPLFWLETK